MDPARMFKESLTPRPELENSQGQNRPSRSSLSLVWSIPKSSLDCDHAGASYGPEADKIYLIITLIQSLHLHEAGVAPES
jgi:hypothetical protein